MAVKIDKEASQDHIIQTSRNAASLNRYAYQRATNGGEAQNRGSQSQAIDIQEQIRLRAYELFIERGRQEGFAGEDWDRAEA